MIKQQEINNVQMVVALQFSHNVQCYVFFVNFEIVIKNYVIAVLYLNIFYDNSELYINCICCYLCFLMLMS